MLVLFERKDFQIQFIGFFITLIKSLKANKDAANESSVRFVRHEI